MLEGGICKMTERERVTLALLIAAVVVLIAPTWRERLAAVRRARAVERRPPLAVVGRDG
jgi:hypothetical protein